MPFDGALDLIVNYYGIIPVNRGQLDRKAMSKAVSVLEQKGFLGGIYQKVGSGSQVRCAPTLVCRC